MKQYNQIKAKYPDALLLFRVGDFYETFGADAVKAAKILGIIQTKRGAGSTSETELAGFPHHSLNTYLPKLVKAGCRVAICDQLEDPKMTKKIVKRGVTELVTPGVALNDDVLEQKKNNYLAAVVRGKKNWGVAFLDISTGDFLVSQGELALIIQLIQNFHPSEVLVPKPLKSEFQKHFNSSLNAFFIEDWVFQHRFAETALTQHFKVKTLKGFGIENHTEGIICGGAILHYLSETQHDKLNHIRTIQKIASDDFVGIDRFTARNLELLYSTASNGVALIDVIDFTATAMGGRLLRNWVSFPLKSIEKIEHRQTVVAAFLKEIKTHENVLECLNKIGDIERLMAKIATQKISPRELILLSRSLGKSQDLKKWLAESRSDDLQLLAQRIPPGQTLRETIETTLKEEAPVATSKGHFIADGYSSDLDELRRLLQSGKTHLDTMLERESAATGIPSLKIAFNNVFGYYIEVRNTHRDKVPENWTRKQTLVNAERYITEELKAYETKILGAEEKIQQLELNFYQQLLDSLQPTLGELKEIAVALSQIDCLQGFAQLAQKHAYCCPKVEQSTRLEILDGRHPVIEQQLDAGEEYIANDILLDRETQQIIMITGPNMSGKSALLRQTALIVILAQMGSFVPAKQVTMGVVDHIFTRVGASDNLSLGESTFMVEMNESAAILNNITAQSLVLLDEIGRGTATYDGISIAWAIAEYLHQHPSQAKTLFATHYHELNEMAHRFKRIKNYNVAVKEMKDTVLFLRKLQAGGSAHSFGIHVAKMAGMPQEVITTAERKLQFLEKSHQEDDRKTALTKDENEMQLSFITLDDPLLEAIRDEIVDLDINALTPVEALMKLNAIKDRLSGKNNT
ncbi:MAG: DNA mismatch repair protein MutS [Flavobacteriaceae bacterium]